MFVYLQVASPSIGEADDEQLSEPGTPRFATPAKGRKGDLYMRCASVKP